MEKGSILYGMYLYWSIHSPLFTKLENVDRSVVLQQTLDYPKCDRRTLVKVAPYDLHVTTFFTCSPRVLNSRLVFCAARVPFV